MPKSKQTIFYIVRHGQTDWNAKKIIQGQTDTPLNEIGEKQARKAAETFKKINFDLVISSDLMRAKKTAELLTLEHKIVIETTNKLRERAFGDLEGKSSSDFFAYLEMLNTLTHEERRQKKHNANFESDDEVATRTITFLREASVANPGKTILVTTHGGVLIQILLHLGYFDYKTISEYTFGNLSYIKLKSDGVDFFVEDLNGINKRQKDQQIF